jgi:hypothetical protein
MEYMAAIAFWTLLHEKHYTKADLLDRPASANHVAYKNLWKTKHYYKLNPSKKQHVKN